MFCRKTVTYSPPWLHDCYQVLQMPAKRIANTSQIPDKIMPSQNGVCQATMGGPRPCIPFISLGLNYLAILILSPNSNQLLAFSSPPCPIYLFKFAPPWSIVIDNTHFIDRCLNKIINKSGDRYLSQIIDQWIYKSMIHQELVDPLFIRTLFGVLFGTKLKNYY